jgi:hypothetical protein
VLSPHTNINSAHDQQTPHDLKARRAVSPAPSDTAHDPFLYRYYPEAGESTSEYLGKP